MHLKPLIFGIYCCTQVPVRCCEQQDFGRAKDMRIPKEVVAGLLIMVGPLIAAIYKFDFKAPTDSPGLADSQSDQSDQFNQGNVESSLNKSDSKALNLSDGKELPGIWKKEIVQFKSNDHREVCSSRISISVSFYPEPLSKDYRTIEVRGVPDVEGTLLIDPARLPITILRSCKLSSFRFVDISRSQKRAELAFLTKEKKK